MTAKKYNFLINYLRAIPLMSALLIGIETTLNRNPIVPRIVNPTPVAMAVLLIVLALGRVHLLRTRLQLLMNFLLGSYIKSTASICEKLEFEIVCLARFELSLVSGRKINKYSITIWKSGKEKTILKFFLTSEFSNQIWLFRRLFLFFLWFRIPAQSAIFPSCWAIINILW